MRGQQQKKVWLGQSMTVLALLTASVAGAENRWFTMEGDSKNAALDTVEVDTLSLSRDAENRSMNLRVSRSTQRTSWEGVPYRSYTAQVVFNCAQQTARYKWLAFYMLPLWSGPVHTTSRYAADEIRPMQFTDAQPNPAQRIIHAACRTPLDNDDSNNTRQP